jgi:hypothetical protein
VSFTANNTGKPVSLNSLLLYLDRKRLRLGLQRGFQLLDGRHQLRDVVAQLLDGGLETSDFLLAIAVLALQLAIQSVERHEVGAQLVQGVLLQLQR